MLLFFVTLSSEIDVAVTPEKLAGRIANEAVKASVELRGWAVAYGRSAGEWMELSEWSWGRMCIGNCASILDLRYRRSGAKTRRLGRLFVLLAACDLIQKRMTVDAPQDAKDAAIEIIKTSGECRALPVRCTDFKNTML